MKKQHLQQYIAAYEVISNILKNAEFAVLDERAASAEAKKGRSWNDVGILIRRCASADDPVMLYITQDMYNSLAEYYDGDVSEATVYETLLAKELDLFQQGSYADGRMNIMLNGVSKGVWAFRYGKLLRCATEEADNAGKDEAAVRELKREVRQLRAVAEIQSRHNNLVGRFVEEMNNRYEEAHKQYVKNTTQAGPAVPLRPMNNAATLAGIPTLFLSDLHWGERVVGRQVQFWNEFDREIAERRLNRVVTESMDILLHHLSGNYYDGISVLFGGDFVSGNIHKELETTNYDVMPQIVHDLALKLARAIRLLASEFPKVYVGCVVGNHGRLDMKPSAKNAPTNSFDYMVYNVVRTLCSDLPNVLWEISGSLDLRYSLYNTKYLLTHGDQIKYQGGIGGFMVPAKKVYMNKHENYARMNMPFDYMVFGHFHQLKFMDNMICNGSLKGVDEYAFRGNFGNEPPQQALWITHPQLGITQFIPVFAEAPKAMEQPVDPFTLYNSQEEVVEELAAMNEEWFRKKSA